MLPLRPRRRRVRPLPSRVEPLTFPSVTVGGTGAALAGVWLALTLGFVLATLAL